MKHDATPQGSRPFQRKQKLIDRRWQLGLACGVTMLLLGAGAIYILGSRFVHSERVVEWSGDAMHGALAVGFDVLYFLGLVGVIHHVIVSMTHAVVGPAFVVERGLRSLREGRYDARFKLRDNDYLRGVAGAADELQTQLRERATLVRDEIEKMRSMRPAKPEIEASLAKIEGALLARTVMDQTAVGETSGAPAGDGPDDAASKAA